MQTIGFFKFHRELFGKPIWEDSTPEQKVISITLLGMANYENNTWEYKGDTYTVNAGEVITSIPTIIKNCGKGITEKKVRVALKHFEEMGFIKDEILVRNKSRKITIVNWGKYQFKNDEKRADVLADGMEDKRADSKNLETIDNKGFESIEENKRADTMADGMADDVHPIKEIKKFKKNNTMSGKPNASYPFDEIVSHLNAKCGKNFKPTTKATQSLIKARMNEGFTVDDFKRVIDTMTNEWKGKVFSNGMLGDNYLQPTTLFGTKFEGYLNKQPAPSAQQPIELVQELPAYLQNR